MVGVAQGLIGSYAAGATVIPAGTPWDVGTMNFVREFSVLANAEQPAGVWFNTNGTRMFVLGNIPARIAQYNLSTAFDISTASYQAVLNLTAPGTTNYRGLWFQYNGGSGAVGAYMYVLSATSDRVHQYVLSTAYDITTASYRAQSNITVDTSPSAGWAHTGNNTSVVGTGSDTVRKYVHTTSVITNMSLQSSGSVSAQELQPTGLAFRWLTGTLMYVSGYAGDDVNQYGLSVANAPSNLSLIKNRTFAAAGGNNTFPFGLYISGGGSLDNDGYYLYVCDYGRHVVQQYSMAPFPIYLE